MQRRYGIHEAYLFYAIVLQAERNAVFRGVLAGSSKYYFFCHKVFCRKDAKALSKFHLYAALCICALVAIFNQFGRHAGNDAACRETFSNYSTGSHHAVISQFYIF